MSHLFSTLMLRNVEFRNRIFVSPMCQYSCTDGVPNDWHVVHLGSRAVGGAGLVLTEATAVSPQGRITPFDCGLWSEAHIEPFRRITTFIRGQGAVPGVQLAHAGRKASTDAPWHGGQPVGPERGGWRPLGPAADPFDTGHPAPLAMTAADIAKVEADFAAAAERSLEAGFEVVELHMAHGYLMHQFFSPLVNRRADDWGGNFDNRIRLPLQVARAVRQRWPDHLPLFVRISATDWIEGGWDIEQSVLFARRLKEIGVDFIDCSSGGAVPKAPVPAGPGYQVPLAATIRREASIPTGAVGFITQPYQAEQIVATGQADAVIIAREYLRDPYWPLHAAKALGAEIPWPPQYLRAKT